MASDFYRYAIYWAPDSGSALDAFASGWLGRDAGSDRNVSRFDLPLPVHLGRDEITAEARRYGFHATLKPPFRLAANASTDDLEAGVAQLAGRLEPVRIDGLAIAPLGSFLALVPCPAAPQLDGLAADCVTGLDRFRAPADEADIARRRKAGLTARQNDLLLRYGYPYLLDEFRFHLTLTGKLAPGDLSAIADLLQEIAAPALGPQRIDTLSLFVEPEPGAEFRLLRRFPVGRVPQGGDSTDE